MTSIVRGNGTLKVSPDWDAPRGGAQSPLRPLAVIVAPILVIAAIIGLTNGPAAGLVVATIGAIGVWAWFASAGKRFLDSWDARPAVGEERISNLVLGLSADLGMSPAPKVWLVADEDPNAFSVWYRGGNLGLTSGLVASFTRTETEAVVAHCLVRLRDEKGAPTLGATLASFGLMGARPDRGYEDVKAAAVTQYPPALATAIERCTPRAGKGSSLWLVSEEDGAGSQDARAAALRDL